MEPDRQSPSGAGWNLGWVLLQVVALVIALYSDVGGATVTGVVLCCFGTATLVRVIFGPGRQAWWIQLLAGIAAVTGIGLVIGGTMAPPAPDHPRVTVTTPPPSPATATSPTPEATPTPDPPSRLISAGEPCLPPDPTDRILPEVEICVVYWCQGDVFLENGARVFDQRQIKVKPRLINNSTRAIRIAIDEPSALRLLVRGRDLGSHWSPPRKTAAAGDAPVLVTWQGAQYWAIPPNVPRDAYPTPAGVYTGFATAWDGEALAPGEAYFRPVRTRPDGGVIREGVLVFQVPLLNPAGMDVGGLALIDFGGAEPEVLAVAGVDDWPEPTAPGLF